MNRKTYLLTICILCFFISCSSYKPEIITIQSYNTFARTDLVQGKLGVSGVISLDDQLDTSECEAFANLLLGVINKEKTGLVTASVAQIVQAIGAKTYNKILAEYKKYPKTRLHSLKEIESTKTGFRYMLFGSFDLNETTKETYREVRRIDVNDDVYDLLLDFDQEEDDSESIEEEIHFIFKTTRTIKFSFYIYDTENASLVWRARIENGGSNQRSTIWDKKDGFAGDVAQSVTQGVVEGLYGPLLYPEAPAVETIIKPVFKVFAQKLP